MPIDEKVDEALIKRAKILIVDDESFCIDVLVKFAKKMGCSNICTALNGKESISQIDSFAKGQMYFDIVIMDCNMPVMDGLEASRQIKQMVNMHAIKPLDIMALTANVGTAEEQSCKKAGMDHYCTKPISFEAFKRKVSEMLKNHFS